MLTSHILVALLTTAGIVESREMQGAVVARQGACEREEWLWMIRRKVRNWGVLKYLDGNNQISVASEIRIRTRDSVVMLTSHPVCVTHQALVTNQERDPQDRKNLGQRSTAASRRIILSMAETPLAPFD
jgi:hypothetical protein